MDTLKIYFSQKMQQTLPRTPRPKPVIIITTVDSVPAAGSTSSDASYTKSVDYCFQHSVCQKTEIMRVLEDVYNGWSENSTKNVVDLFKTMFPDSKAAKKMQLKLSKLKYVVNHGIAPYVQDILKEPGHRRCLVCCIIWWVTKWSSTGI